MQYNLDFEFCGLCFLIIIAIHFFGKYRSPFRANRIFGTIIIIMLVSLVSNIIGGYTIAYAEVVPLWLNMTVNMIYYTTLIFTPPMIFLLILELTGRLQSFSNKLHLIIMFPVLASELLLLTNPLSKFYFYFDASMMYQWGIGYYTVYVFSMLYILLGIVTLIAVRKELRPIQFRALFIFSFIFIFSAILQFIVKTYLITNCCIVMAILVIYLTLQNPMDTRDVLTGLLNRNGFLRYIEERLEKNTSLNVVIFGVDKMKIINEVFGMAAGNAVIERIAGETKRMTSTSSLVFRISGDVFVIAAADKETCQDNLKQVIERFNTTWEIDNMSVGVTVCVCSARDMTFSQESPGVLMMLEYMLGEAKKKGAGSIMHIKKENIGNMERQFDIETGIRKAIRSNEIEVAFQPIYSTSKGKIIAAEALARFEHKKLGNIPPQEFIPIIEKNGLILDMGRQVQRKVFKAIRAYNLDRIEDFHGVQINVSAVELMNSRLNKQLMDLLNKYKIKGNNIILEITETTAIAAREIIEGVIKKIQAQNIRFALDDFGTGYSNIDIVMQLPFSTVKIDRMMMLESLANEKSAIIFEEVVKMIRRLDLNIIVEGVETEEEANTMIERGIDYIQGFYYGKPMPIEDLAKELKRDRD